MNYIIYTDGAYSSNRNKMGIGLVWLKDNKLLSEYSAGITGGTNNKAELIAVILALRSIKNWDDVNSITIVSDSQYVIGCATKGWERKANKDLWKVFDEAYKEANKYTENKIVFSWVKGHNENKYNDRCDKLAVKGSL